LARRAMLKGFFCKTMFFLMIHNLCMYKKRLGCHVFGGNMYALLLPIFFAKGVGM
jgi:hypothetical protein